MLPDFAGIITLAACFIPRNGPKRFTFRTLRKSSGVAFKIGPNGSSVAALLNIMSNFLYMETAVFTVVSMSDSFVTVYEGSVFRPAKFLT